MSTTLTFFLLALLLMLAVFADSLGAPPAALIVPLVGRHP